MKRIMFLVLASLLLHTAGATVALAEPGNAEAAVDLKLFLTGNVGKDYRVLNFNVAEQENVGPVRRHIRYQARVEFSNGLNATSRAALRGEDIDVIEGSVEELSSAKLVVDLRRQARFVQTEHGWVLQVGTTRFLLSRNIPAGDLLPTRSQP